MNGYRIIPDGKPFRKGEKGWYKPNGCEHWMLLESMISGNLTIPVTAPFFWERIREEEKNDIKRN